MTAYIEKVSLTDYLRSELDKYRDLEQKAYEKKRHEAALLRLTQKDLIYDLLVGIQAGTIPLKEVEL